MGFMFVWGVGIDCYGWKYKAWHQLINRELCCIPFASLSRQWFVGPVLEYSLLRFDFLPGKFSSSRRGSVHGALWPLDAALTFPYFRSACLQASCAFYV